VPRVCVCFSLQHAQQQQQQLVEEVDQSSLGPISTAECVELSWAEEIIHHFVWHRDWKGPDQRARTARLDGPFETCINVQ